MSAGVTFPRGFRAAGMTAGLKASNSPDLGLLVADLPCSAAGVFTTNAFAAAPVRLCRARLVDGAAQAVLVNSGQANAATGEDGDRDAEAATAAAAGELVLQPELVLGCSTGVIGEPIHMRELLTALPGLATRLNHQGGRDFARAIMTTDTVPKQAQSEVGGLRVGGAAKGVGMIAPNLATMLVFVTTDAHVPPAAAHELVVTVLEPKFESLTVDACTSTNDTVLLLASGAAGGDPVTPGSPGWSSLAIALDDVGESLLRQLAADAEGMHHVLLIEVSGARNNDEARLVAKAVADSPLVKTAAFGGDPNPGRILQAVGSSGAPVEPPNVDIRIGDVPVVAAGVIPPAYFEAGGDEAARGEMDDPEIAIHIRVGTGAGASRSFGCDLSYDYVKINGEYTT